MKIMLAGVFLVLGWLWAYLFIRQFLFNFMTAFPLIKKMSAVSESLIAVGAKRYTVISVIASGVFAVIAAVVIILLCPLYMKLSFFIGGIVSLLMITPTLSYKKRPMFDIFCTSYCRFVSDDELRMAMYNKKPSQMKVRLHALGLSTDFIPKFED